MLFSFYIAHPQITNISPDIVAILHDTVQLNCIGHGSPQPSVTWYYNNAVVGSISTSTDAYTVNSVLTLPNIALHDAGVYTCTATNVLSTITKNVTATVQGMAIAMCYYSFSL